MHPGSVHRFHIVDNNKAALIKLLDNVYCLAKITIAFMYHSLSYSKSKKVLNCEEFPDIKTYFNTAFTGLDSRSNRSMLTAFFSCISG